MGSGVLDMVEEAGKMINTQRAVHSTSGDATETRGPNLQLI